MEQHIRLWHQHDVNTVPTQTYMGCSVAPWSQHGIARINTDVTQIYMELTLIYTEPTCIYTETTQTYMEPTQSVHRSTQSV